MQLIFAGTPEFAAQHLRALLDVGYRVVAVVTQPDQPGKRGRRLVAPPVKVAAAAAGLEVLQPAKMTLQTIAGLRADLMVVVAYGQILRLPVLQHPRLGSINVHTSLLPRWRGAAPMQRALLAGDETTGVSLIQMDEGIDTGALLAQRPLAIAADDTCGTLQQKLCGLGMALLVETLGRLGSIVPQPQPEAGACYAPMIGKEEAQIDWTQPAVAIERQIRAFNPAPGAYSFLNGMRVKLWQARVAAAVSGAAPGTIAALDRRAVTIACGEGSLAVGRLQLPRGKGTPLSAADLVNAWSGLVHPGLVFGRQEV